MALVEDRCFLGGFKLRYSSACTRCTQLALASITATAVSMSVVAAPSVRSQLPNENHMVQLQAATVSAIQNTAALATDAAVGDGLSAAQTVSPGAATGDLADIFTTVARGIASAIGPIIAPIWWLGAPVTVPLWSILSSTLFPNYPKSFGIPFFAVFPAWLIVPLNLDDLLFPLPPANTTTTPSWVSGSAATAATAASESEEITEPSTAEAITAQHSVPTAAATTEDNFLDSPLGSALIAVNVLLLPLWFLAAPITLPLSMFAAVSQIPEDDPIATLKFLVLTAIGFLTGPIGVFDIFTRQTPTPAAAVKPSAARSLVPGEDIAQENAAEPSLSADDEPVAEQTAMEGTLTRGAATARPTEPRPKRATAAKPAASASSSEGVASPNAEEANHTTKTRSPAERASRSSVEKAGRQARAIGSTE